MLRKIKTLILEPYSIRNFVKKIIKKFKLGSYKQRLQIGAVARPIYGYLVYNSASLAMKLGLKRISIIEFGVAGGDGLVNLEYHCKEIKKLFDVEIDIYGFDMGEGLPEPNDYRDLPYHWQKGFYKMDVPLLKSRLKKAKLILGDIKDTSVDFFEKYNPAPIGAIIYDFDFYTSTVNAVNMLKANERHYLPRVFCCFDDIIGSEIELYNEYTGARLAINEFNQSNNNIKIGLPHYLFERNVVESWYFKIRICHFFRHSRYNEFVSNEDQQLPC